MDQSKGRRARGSGSLSYREADQRWIFMVDLGLIGGKRKRRAFYGLTADEAEGRARAEFPNLRPSVSQVAANMRTERMRAARLLGRHTRREWFAKLRALDYRCHYCGVDLRLPRVRLTKDHLTPVSRGGSDGLDNVVPACMPCNYSKADMTAEEFALVYPERRAG